MFDSIILFINNNNIVECLVYMKDVVKFERK